LGLGSTLSGTDTWLLDRLDQTVPELGFKEYTTDVRISTLNMFAYTLSLMVGTAGLPHVIIRFFTVPKVRDARSSAGWALVFIAVLYTTAPAVGAMARYNIMNTVEPEPGQYLAYEERPQWFKNWDKTGLLGYTDKKWRWSYSIQRG
jgi:cation/acetate symporter